MARIITGAEFDEEVIKSDIPVLVDFFATWCGPCKMIAPVLDEISAEYSGKAKILKVDVDASNELAGQFGVRSVPTLIFFKNGEIADKQIGAMTKGDLAARIDKLL